MKIHPTNWVYLSDLKEITGEEPILLDYIYESPSGSFVSLNCSEEEYEEACDSACYFYEIAGCESKPYKRAFHMAKIIKYFRDLGYTDSILINLDW